MGARVRRPRTADDWAICRRCRQVMEPGGSCKPERGVLRWAELPADAGWDLELTHDCHDCNARPGGWHHAGCLLRYDAQTGEQL
jgi:hypothetical protein